MVISCSIRLDVLEFKSAGTNGERTFEEEADFAFPNPGERVPLQYNIFIFFLTNKLPWLPTQE